jgi:hypothetical protein
MVDMDSAGRVGAELDVELHPAKELECLRGVFLYFTFSFASMLK